MKLFRKRYVPEEILELRDEVVYCDDDVLVTRWNPINPRTDFHHGTSCFFLKENLKVSKMYHEDNTVRYWYCDIGECVMNREEDTFTFVDLLADVIVYPDGRVRVVDLGEIADVQEAGVLDAEKVRLILRRLDWLLAKVYGGTFSELQAALEERESITKTLD